MTRPDPNKIKLAGSGSTSDTNPTLSTIFGADEGTAIPFGDHVMLPGMICNSPFSTILHMPVTELHGTIPGSRTSESKVNWTDVEPETKVEGVMKNRSLTVTPPGSLMR